MAYEYTKVNYIKSQAQIGELLKKYQILDKVFMDKASENKAILVFKKPIDVEGEKFDLGVRITLLDVTEKNMDTKYRVLFHWLKNKFEIIKENMFGNEIESFTKEFFAYLIISPGGITIYDKLGMDYYKGITEKKIDQNLQLEFN